MPFWFEGLNDPANMMVASITDRRPALQNTANRKKTIPTTSDNNMAPCNQNMTVRNAVSLSCRSRFHFGFESTHFLIKNNEGHFPLNFELPV
jgi:hypothetical protein